MKRRDPWAPVLLGLGALGAGAILWRLTMTDGGAARVYKLDPATAPFGTRYSPGCLVIVPPGADGSRVWVYLRGWNSCVSVLAGSVNGPCRAGGPSHVSSHLADQLVASGSRAVLVMPELEVERNSGDPGALGHTGGLAALLAEVLPLAGLPPVPSWLGVMSHSGGYQAARAALVLGGLPVSACVLLDSLYGYEADFRRWAEANPGAPFGAVFTDGGNTASKCRSIAADLRIPVTEDSGSGPLSGRVVCRTRQSHSGLTTTFPGRFWEGIG